MPDQTPPIGDSDHDKAMIAKVDAAAAAHQKPPADTPQDPPAPPQRPDDIPEKFWDAEKGQVRVEDLLKSYRELEAAKSQSKPDETPKDPPADPEKALADAKVDVNAISDEFAREGKLSDKSYEALAKVGFGKEIVDAYIAGQQAIVAQREAKGFELAGGQEQFSRMAEWAATNLTEADRAAFNEAIMGSEAQMAQAVLALRARYEQANGSDPALVKGASGTGQQGAFGSRAEMTAAMRDPRYARDPAYRAEVERRVGMSSFF